MSSKYMKPIKRLGTAAIIAFIISLVFPLLTNALSEETRRSVLINAIPFFAAFVGVLLLFILLIFMVALRYNGHIPGRTYNSIEQVIIGAIPFSVICLFQPFSPVPYRYGFLLLLIATLSFILWSHVVPRMAKAQEQSYGLSSVQRAIAIILGVLVGLFMQADLIKQLGAVLANSADAAALSFPFSTFQQSIQPIHGLLLLLVALLGYFVWNQLVNPPVDERLPMLSTRSTLIGAAAGLLVVVLLVSSTASANAPQAPYGVRERVWNTYPDEKKAAIAEAATHDFSNVEVPFLIVLSLFPASIVLFLTREVVSDHREIAAGPVSVPVASGGD